MKQGGLALVFLMALVVPLRLSAQEVGNFLVLGVIASNKNQEGVALMKDMKTQRTFALKEGAQFCNSCKLKSVQRKYISVVINSKTYELRVGDETATAMADAAKRSDYLVANAQKEIRKEGNTVEVSSAYKEHLIKTDLSKILMQAAAVPTYENGKLRGFQLWEIEPESVYDVAGLRDGDLITSINGTDLTDVGMTIRQLNSLRDASEATFHFVREGTPQELKIVVQ